MTKQTLPIDSYLPQITSGVQAHSACIVIAEPGAGKTTRVPVALSDSIPGKWIVLQPRRWAARLNAERIAEENGFRLGGGVGYQVRFENRSSPETRILLMTEGLLLRKLVEDPELSGVAGVVLDEFHERSLDLDLTLALLKEIQASLNPDLKIVVMSATLDPKPLLEFLPGAVLFEIPGRVFPVEKRYLETRSVVTAVKSVLPDSGDVLVFLPGAFEIGRAVSDLTEWVREEHRSEFEVLPLYASLPEDLQRQVFRESSKRKIICSTNIAETSLTLPRIKAVVDSGLQKVMRMDPALGFDRLETLRISKASSEQRAGRAGRVSAGVVLRMWSVGEQEQLRHFETPEVQRVNLGRALLTLSEFGVRDFQKFDWFEVPKSSMLDFAIGELRYLGFLGDQGITPAGKKALRLPLDPSVSAVVLASDRAGCFEFGARFGALLESISKEERILDEEQFIRRLNRLTQTEQKVAAQIFRSDSIPQVKIDDFTKYESILIEAGRSRICVADRIVGRRRVRAREGHLPEVSLLLSAMDQGDLVVSSLVPISKTSLLKFAQKKKRTYFDESSLRVKSVQGVFFEDLELSVLSEVQVSSEEASPVLSAYLAREREGFLGRLGSEVTLFLKRLDFAKAQLPWEDVIPALVSGRTRLDDLKSGEVVSLLRGLMDREHFRQMEAFAPERIEVPSGSLIPIDYSVHPPKVSVRLQEVFGWLETPRVGGGKIPLLMELLSPGFRPIQVTQDLRSFWAGTYFEVRRELKIRYPKHAWPEDPLTAKPEAKGRRRS